MSMHTGRERVKYTGGNVTLASRPVLVHVKDDGSKVQEQVVMVEGRQRFTLVPQEKMTAQDWLKVIAALGFVAAVIVLMVVLL